MKSSRNPISFLEDSFHLLKEYLETEINNTNMTLTPSYIQELKKETLAVLALCDTLNKDAVFIQKINALVTSGSNSLLLKAEHFFISDIILAYNQNLEKETPKSRFALAYYYDVLRNNQFADEKAINTLNKLVTTEEFKKHLDKIKKENTLKPNDSRKYLILSILSETSDSRFDDSLKKIEKFLQFSYDIKFKDQKELIDFLDFKSVSVVTNSDISALPPDDTLEKVLDELHQLIGLEEVKNDVKELINLLNIQKKRSEQGLKNIEVTLHTVFLGPPGTGKTTVARLLSRIYKHLGFLSKGQLYETDREGMIAGYVGQTATKVDKVVEGSIGGVLFIDEAYSLTQNAFGNDYGAEAVNTLLKRMEDHRDDLAVVVAGYTEPMKLFVESNPGLRSRFNRYFHFDHFKPAELFHIFESYCKNADFIISEDAKEKLNDTFELLYSKKDEGFGNARVVRNLFEKCVQLQANRIIKLSELNHEVLKTFTEEDIPEPKETQEQVFFMKDNTATDN